MYCGAVERHRMTWKFFEDKTDLFNGQNKNMLHIAPEEFFEGRLKKELRDGYLTADLLNPKAMVEMDITDIKYPNSHFDVIFCSHVLEHVSNDRLAMREFARVLKPDGWAILLVPITADKTFEDSSIVTPAERLQVFGQEDHVRRYGPDYVDRLRESGLDVRVYAANEFMTDDQIRKMAIDTSEEIYFCTKMST
jgi:SAM-dependent methyltransferase